MDRGEAGRASEGSEAFEEVGPGAEDAAIKQGIRGRVPLSAALISPFGLSRRMVHRQTGVLRRSRRQGTPCDDVLDRLGVCENEIGYGGDVVDPGCGRVPAGSIQTRLPWPPLAGCGAGGTPDLIVVNRFGRLEKAAACWPRSVRLSPDGVPVIIGAPTRYLDARDSFA